MGLYAYAAYGVRVDIQDTAELTDAVEEALCDPAVKAACPDVSYLGSGCYRPEKFFLVTYAENAGVGEHVPIGYDGDVYGLAYQQADWDRQLAALVCHLGWERYVLNEPPGWFITLDVS